MTMQQPEALRLAHLLELDKWPDAAEELRRLHAENQELKEQMAAIGAGGVEPLRKRSQAHECHEALTACINLLKKTPKITQSMFVGKDRQAWGVQAKAVLEAALAAQAKQ